MTAIALLSVLVLSSVSWTGTDAVYMLPNDSFPLSYIIHFEPDLDENHFYGTVTIDFNMTITTSVLVINQRDLIIDTIEIEGIKLRTFHTDHDTQMLTMYCVGDLVENNTYRLTIEYEGILTDSRIGFYRSGYIIGNETKWIATTHFEPIGARLAFPCWDEPKYKAVFNISIRHQSIYTAVISNMPEWNRTYFPDLSIITKFERSMPMSTYLVAFVISDYTYKSHHDNRFKIFTKPDSVDKTDLAYEFSLTAMKLMEDYTEIPYFKINPKMDQATIRDFFPSAMENWGLVTYREDYLLYEEGVSTSTDKDNVITTISHEFSHQWFGNLVSPQWWKYVWLNEGFANYFQYHLTHKVKPTWRYIDLFPVEAMQHGAFIHDMRNAHPLDFHVEDPSDIHGMFDLVSYYKGGSIIRMLQHLLTEKVFHLALKNYLRENSFGVADSDNLIRHFQQAAGENVRWAGADLREIVRTWIKQSGYPMVTVRNMSPGFFTLSQEQFSFDDPDEGTRWWIPITFATNYNLNFEDTTVTEWMKPKIRNPLIAEPKADWILLNKQQTGYYRVNYDDELWQKLIKFLKSSNMHLIHPVNRAQLIDDALAMARTNHTKYETAMSLTLYLYREVDYIPWLTTFQNLEFLRHKIFPSKHYDIFKHYIRYIMHSLTTNVTYVASPTDDHPMKILKGNAMKWACLADVKECVDAAQKEFHAWLTDRNHRLDPDLKNTILCTGLRTASEEVWDEALKKLTQGTFDRDGKTSPLEVLGCSNNRKILHKFLIYSGQTDGYIRFQTAAKAVIRNTNVTGVEIVQSVLLHDLIKIVHMHDFPEQISAVINDLAKAITNNDDFLSLSKFVVSTSATDGTVTAVLIESMRNIKWIATYGRVMDDWLLKHEEFFKSSATVGSLMSWLVFLTILNIFMFHIFV